MRTDKRVLIAVSICLIFLVSAANPGRALQGGQPIPPLPDPSVIAKVIAASQGPTYTAIHAPTAPLNSLRAGPFSRATQRLNPERAVHVMNLNVGPRRSAIPLTGSETATLQPDTQTPDDALPAQVIGVAVDSTQGSLTLVAVWKNKTDKTPSEIRFYQDNKALPDSKSDKVIVRQLRGDKTGKAAPGDQGVIIAARETCFTLGLSQACYAPLKYTRDEQIAAVVAKAAQDLSAVFTFTVQFDLDGGVAEVIGSQQRSNCDKDLSKLSRLPAQAMPNCAPNLIFTATTEIQNGQPIGLFAVQRPVTMTVYDTQGDPANTLPAGNYLVIDATPAAAQNTPGAAGALFLVSSKGAYLIPAQTSEGFGSTTDQDANTRRGQAAVKDGFISGHNF